MINSNELKHFYYYGLDVDDGRFNEKSCRNVMAMAMHAELGLHFVVKCSFKFLAHIFQMTQAIQLSNLASHSKGHDSSIQISSIEINDGKYAKRSMLCEF